MSYQPLKDKKFVALLVDVLTGLVLYFAGKYASPSLFDDIKIVFALLQPMIALYIAGEFQADSIQLKQGNAPVHFMEKK